MKKRKLFISILTVFFVCFMGVAFSACGEEHTHSYTQQITTQATCTEKGIITYTCSCSNTYRIEIPATGEHSLPTEYSYNEYVHWFDCDTCGGLIETESHQKVLGECIICHATLIPNILLIERNEGESDNLKYLLEYSGESVEIDTLHILVDDLPTTAFELCAYDEVILVNIANADMPMGFDEILHEYVYDLGGSMLTVGGNRNVDGEVVANAYNREDMYGTLYQEMLPVQAIDYTPPIGVMIIIDSSGSMESSSSASGQTKLDLAKEGAKACLDALTERDYVGIMTLDDTYSEELALTPRTQEAKILAAIDSIQIGGGTVFVPALMRAGFALRALANVQKRHVILITDGLPSDPYEYYASIMEGHYETAGITYSMFLLDDQLSPSEKAPLREATEKYGGGRFYDVNVNNLAVLMYEELNVPEIKAVNYEPFVPTIANYTNVVTGIEQENMPELDGFYGTKLKGGATATLMGEYTPIYADWNYGNGKVGSFMCDLNMVWSQSFMLDATGQRLILNIVYSLIE